MSLKEVYQQFLADPRSVSLAPDVSLIYITTTTTFDGSDAVLNHLSRQQHIVKKKSEDILSVIEAPDSLCLDVETSLEFVSSGGVYLPQLDDNFLADRVATFPMIHIVRFNAQKEIQQIRLYWDQASLLKQVEVIGARSRNWPIRDAKDQTRLIKSAFSAVGVNKVAPSAPSENKESVVKGPANPVSPSKKHIKDPYAAESLFELLSPGTDRTQPVRAPRAPASAKPAPREYSELFVGEDGDAPDASPSKSKVVAPKAGSSKNYQRSRLFDDDETVAKEEKPRLYKTHPKKFGHFDLGGDNSDREIKPVVSRPKSTHLSQWEFEDFVTPEKPNRQPRGQEVRHFGWSDDEADLKETPPAKPRAVQPRRDAETHIQFTDEDDGQNGKRIISSFQNKGLGLYQSHLYGQENEPTPVKSHDKAPLSVVANGAHRKKDFDSHWVMTDSSPANENVKAENMKPVGGDHMKAVKMMEPHWDTYDVSPQPSKAATLPRRPARHVNQRSFAFGDEDM